MKKEAKNEMWEEYNSKGRGFRDIEEILISLRF